MTMTGRLVDWPQRWDFDDGGLKATFRLARSERRLDGERGWVDGPTLYLSVSCRRVIAERVLATLKKGDPVIVRGRLRTREWDKDGRHHSVIELDANAVGPDLALCSATVLRKPSAAPGPDAVTEPGAPAAARGTSAVGEPEPDQEEAEWGGEPSEDEPWPGTREAAEAGVGR